MNIRTFQPSPASLPATLAGDGSPASLTAALDMAQIQLGAIQSVSSHAYGRMILDVQATGMDLTQEATRDKWHNQFLRPQWERADVILTRLVQYQDQLEHLPAILPAWSAAIGRLEHLVAQVGNLMLELERRTDEIFDAEVDRRRAAGLPFCGGEDAE
ncbi:MAG: hypothetical protein A2X76_01270 [Lysobacterales bacterium GWF1_69_6]|nr:MAG: hypothetical protein A2X76_01270 [Xanthomonadales bacterium GWF1_69_6]